MVVSGRCCVCRAFGQQRLPHRARHVAVQPADAVGEVRRAQRQRGHVELAVVFAERDETLAMLGQRSPRPLKMVFDAVEREGVVTRRHRRVRREDRVRCARRPGLRRRSCRAAMCS